MEKFSRREFFEKFIGKSKKAEANLDNEEKKEEELDISDKKISRRTFLEWSGIVAGSLALNQAGVRTSEAGEKSEIFEEKEKIKMDWEQFIYGFCQEDPKKIEELRKILSQIWGEDFQPSIDFYNESDEIKTFYGFLTAGSYNVRTNTIEFNRNFLKKVKSEKNAYRALDAVFHESGHADFRRDNYCILKDIASSLSLKEPEVYDVIVNSKILQKDNVGKIKQSILANKFINEIYASFGEVYASFKTSEKYTFPLEDFLANYSLINRICDTTLEEKQNFFYKFKFDKSIYFSVEFFSILLMKDFNYDFEKIRSFMKSSNFEIIGKKICEIYLIFEKEKLKKSGVDAEKALPSELYDQRFKPDSEMSKNEEGAIFHFFKEFAKEFSASRKVKGDLLEKKIQRMEEDGKFRQLSIHVFDEFLTLNRYFEDIKEKKIEEITPEEKELLEVVKDLYMIFRNGGHQEETKNKMDSTIKKLNNYLKNEKFSAYFSRIENEINNINQIFNRMFNIKGGFKPRSL